MSTKKCVTGNNCILHNALPWSQGLLGLCQGVVGELGLLQLQDLLGNICLHKCNHSNICVFVVFSVRVNDVSTHIVILTVLL